MNEFREYVKIKVIHKITENCLTEPIQIINNVNNLSKEISSDKSIEDILFDIIEIQLLDKHLLREWCVLSKFSKTSLLNTINNFSREIFTREIRNALVTCNYMDDFKNISKKLCDYEDVTGDWKALVMKIFKLEEYHITLVNQLTYYNMNEMVQGL